MKKKPSKFFAILLLILMWQSNIAHAAADVSIARCIAKGGFDFGLFIDSVSYNDSFNEGLIEPWNDVLARNQCQATDVISMIKQEDKIRKYIRDAFLTCNTQKLPSYKISYYKLLAEIYYVRHVVDGGIVLSLPYDLLNARIGKNPAEKDRNLLYSEMSAKYVKKDLFTQEDFDNFFLFLESKYKDRKKTYLSCSVDSWQAVKDKWDEFNKYFVGGGLNKDLKSAGRSISARAQSVAKEFNTVKTVELLKSKTSVKDYLKSFGQFNLNKFEAEEGAGQMSEFLQKSLPSFSANPTQNEVLGALSGAQADFDISKTRNDLNNEFEDLYFTFNDQSMEILMNNLDGRNVVEDGLIEIIQRSLIKLNTLKNKAVAVNSRQCTEIK